MNIFRDLFFWLDKVVYGFIDTFYQLFMQLSNATILSTDTISKFSNRIYALIGVFMLFKIMFSLISLFADPDKLNDSKIGGGVIVKRIVISMLLLVSVPTIFNLGYELQSEVLKQNIIGNIVLGVSTNNTDADSNTEIREVAGKKIMITVFQGFYKPFPNVEFTGGNKETYDRAIAEHNMAGLDELLNAKNGKDYVIDYSFVISTIAGGFTAWILMMFCFDIAVRSIKLGFLQLIAPVPILSYIDTKKGEAIFNKWVSSVTSTFLDIFARITVIYFGIFLIAEITGGEGLWNIYDVTNGSQVMQNQGLLLQAFVILGILLFIKQLPDLIYDILGIKKPGGFTMNPLNKLRQVPGLGKLGGAAMGTLGGALAGYTAGKEAGKPFTGITRGALAGFGSGASKYSFAGSKDGASKKAFTSSLNDVSKNLTGKDYRRFSLNDVLPKEPGLDRIDQLKGAKTVLTKEKNALATKLNAVSYANANLLNEMSNLSPDSAEYAQLETRYNANVVVENTLRANISKFEGKISTINEEIKDVNTFYKIDESTNQKVKEIIDDKDLKDQFEAEYQKNREKRINKNNPNNNDPDSTSKNS